MEKKAKGPFDAAINCLSVMADRDFANGAPHRGQFRAAIAVLEAAGKMDKHDKVRLALWADFYERLCGKHGGAWLPEDDAAYERIRALLSALPDEEPK